MAVSSGQDGHVYIVLTNWNGWRDTIECLESLLRLNYPRYTVLVCDNASTDGSLEQIKRWARGEISAGVANPELARLTVPPIPKPLEYAEVAPGESAPEGRRLVLIPTGTNLGYAGGCNAGIRYALGQGDFEFVWLLNNDTAVVPDSLSHLVQRMQERPDAGICGSTLIYYDDPSQVQVFGGSTYNKWIARGVHIGKLAPANPLPDAGTIERKLGYVYGAAMLVRRSFLEQIGPMNEEYLVYYEELDWVARAKARFHLAYSPSSILYHKEGRVTGSHHSHQSAKAEFYLARNRVLFTRKYYPYAVPTVLLGLALSGIHRVFRGRWDNLSALFRGAVEGFATRPQEQQWALNDGAGGPR